MFVSTPPTIPGSTFSGKRSFNLCCSASAPSSSWPLWTPTFVFQTSFPVAASIA